VKGTPDTRPQRLYLCTINGNGKLADTNEIVELFENTVIQLGDNEVVQGLDMALGLMDEGEKAEIICHSRFAYGTIGLQSKNIPSDATIIYTIELVSNREESDLDKKTYESRKEIGNKKRERGNFFFERQEYNTSIQLYRRALEYLDESEGGISQPTGELIYNYHKYLLY
jgi:FK506-binding protein 8